jgi:hypothetical protein
MKIKVLSLNTKTALATSVYYLAIVALLLLLATILFKFAFSPPCSFIAKNECMVDGWSVAGLAGTVLAVAATLLAVLGAVAVAYWWLDLNKKVDQRVNEQIQAAIEQALKEQERHITEQTTHLLGEQEKQFNEAVSKIQIEMDALKGQASNIENRVQTAKKDLINAMTQLDPWIIEAWASDEMFSNPSSGVGVRMVQKYLQLVDGFLSIDPNDLSTLLDYTKSLQYKSAPYDTLFGYWQKALEWQKKIDPNLSPVHAKTVELWIGMHKATVEKWVKQNGL